MSEHDPETLTPAESMISDRIPAVPREQWTDATRDVFSVFEGEEGRRNGSKFNVVQMCAHHPQMATAFFKYNRILLQEPTIPGRLREIVVLRVAWRNRCEYEWAQHVQISRRDFELESVHFEAVKIGANHQIWSDLERSALHAVDQLAETSTVDEATWRALSEKLDHTQMLELLFLIGNYTLLAWVFNAAGLKLEPSLAGESAFAS
jgi:alkylhydroperoxidase family enzyme